MALRVWLPLNGNINNQGISCTAFSGSPASWGDGKLGKCAVFSNNTANKVYFLGTDYRFTTEDFSWCMWLKKDYSSKTASNMWAFINGRNSEVGGYCYGLRVVSTTGIYAVFGSETWAVSGINDNTWHHIAFTKKDTLVSVYLDGVLKTSSTFSGTTPTYTDAAGLSVGTYMYLNNGNVTDVNPLIGAVSDFRIYDHALSAREVHELSQGLVIHYPMCSAYGSGRANFYSGENAHGSSASVSGMTKTKLDNEDGYRYTITYTGTGSNSHANIRFPAVSRTLLTPGKTYVWSCKVRVMKWSAGTLALRSSIYANDYSHGSTQVMNSSSTIGVWKQYTRTLVLTEGMTIGSGTSQYFYYITTDAYNADTEHTQKRYMAPLVEFYTDARATSGTVYDAIVDIKEAQLIEADAFPGWADGAMSSSTVRDCSGHGNDGTVSSITPTMVSGSPRNSLAWKFNASTNTYIRLPDPISASANEFTISMWIKPENVSGNKCMWNGRTTKGAAVAIFLVGNTIRFDDSNQTTYAASLVANTWYHIVCSWKSGGNKIIYVNGEQKSSVAAGTLSKTNTKATIGSSSNADSNPDSNYVTSTLSDVRVYMTQLSAADIKSLYNAPIRVTNAGSLHSDGELTEGYSSQEFRKTGEVRCSGVSEVIAHFDNTVYFEPDGSTWLRIAHHADPGSNKFADGDTFATHVYKDTKRWFCGEIMDWVDKWEFIVHQRTTSSADAVRYRFVQSVNPKTATYAQTVKANVTYDTTGYSSSTYGGLYYNGGSNSYLVGNNGNNGNWYGAIGCWNDFNTGIPGWQGTTIKDGGFIDLYLRVDNVSWTGTVPGKLSLDKETHGIVSSLIVEN